MAGQPGERPIPADRIGPEDAGTAAEFWLDAGLCTASADRAEAEAAVAGAYELAGLPAPAHFVWMPSPHAAVRAVAALVTGVTPDDIGAALAAQGCPPGSVAPGASVRSKVRTAPWARARAALLARLGRVGFTTHWLATTRRPWQQLQDRIATPLRRRLSDEFDSVFRAASDLDDEESAVTMGFAAAARVALLDAVYGQHDGAWLGAFDVDGDDSSLAGLAGVARHAGWWWPFEHVAILTERPLVVHRDNVGRMHHGDGPAIVWPDGWGIHAWRGMPIPTEVVAELGDLTVARIHAETNAEVRRVMLEYFGFERFLRESKANKIDSSEFGTLWRIRFANDEPLQMVEVVNSTPEPDGTSRTYFLRVPPWVSTARQAVAWTFDVAESDYSPVAQT